MHQGVVQVGVVYHVLEMFLGVVLLVEGKVQEVVLRMVHLDKNNLQVTDLPGKGGKLLHLVQDKAQQGECMVVGMQPVQV